MDDESARLAQPNKRLPPTYFAVALGAMTLLYLVLPGPRWLAGAGRLAGLPLVALGAALAVGPARLFARHGTTIKPFQESSVLVVDGPFRYSRNPIYLGMILILSGVALLLGSLSPLLVVPLFIWLLTARFVRSEEEALELRFGHEYLAYKRRVPRWLGRIRS